MISDKKNNHDILISNKFLQSLYNYYFTLHFLFFINTKSYFCNDYNIFKNKL